jgi:hypothetical protein
MSIVKSKHASNYLVLSNEVFKIGLSLEAIGLLCHLLSLPHDWVIYKTQLHKRVGIGRDKLNNVFKELQESGYILSVKKQNSTGNFEYDHIVYDVPYNGEPHTENPQHFRQFTTEPLTCLPFTAEPLTDEPYTVEPLTVNKTLLSKQEESKQILNKQVVNKTIQLDVYPTFEDFWTTYDKKIERPKSEKAWNKISQSDKEKIMAYLPRYVESTPEKKYRKNPLTFLNNQSWTNEIIRNNTETNNISSIGQQQAIMFINNK